MLAGILTGVSASVCARVPIDSLVMTRVFSYQRNFVHNDVNGFTTNVYTKHNFNTWRRNATLWLVPTMYSIAEGDRFFVSETYSKLRFGHDGKYTSKRQVVFSTIRHNRRTMPTLIEFLTPTLYDELLYRDHLLSPFNRKNRRYYRYAVVPSVGVTAIVTFRPRNNNTQTVSGVATVDMNTGRVIWAKFSGDFDMISFQTEMTQGEEGMRSLLPTRCRTEAEFNFMGNQILATFEGVYDCRVTLPDSVENVASRQLIDSLRPIPLTGEEEYVYRLYDEAHPQAVVDSTSTDSTVTDSTATDTPHPYRRKSFFNDVLRHGIADKFVTSLRYRSEHTYFKLSPILNPQYISYSRRRGTSYKLKFGADYYFNDHRYFEFDPWCGYNFKFKKFYFTLPLRFTYNPKRDGYVTVHYGNGNRTSHASVISEIEREHGNTPDLSGKYLDLFDDNHLVIANNIMVFDWLDVETGVTFHQRKAYNPEVMKQYGKPTEYRSLSPNITFKLCPWHHGPLFTLDYERGIKGFLHSDMSYERWEADCSMKYLINPIKKLNFRLGFGTYTNKSGNYFVDYGNFSDNNLPEGWDDDWTGNFQLLNSRWYNESSYYARANFSYEAPLMCCSWLPLVGHYLEKERLYASALSIDHTRPYYELGYGFTTQFFSIGLFTSILQHKFHNFECKFTFELFRRW